MIVEVATSVHVEVEDDVRMAEARQRVEVAATDRGFAIVAWFQGMSFRQARTLSMSHCMSAFNDLRRRARQRLEVEDALGGQTNGGTCFGANDPAWDPTTAG